MKKVHVKSLIVALVMSCFLIVGLIGCGGSKTEEKAGDSEELKPDKLIEMPQCRQGKGYTCGVAVIQSALYYIGVEYRQEDIEEMVGANDQIGTNNKKMQKLLNKEGVKTEYKEKMTLDELKASIDEDNPVICFIQAWAEVTSEEYKDEWECGHYVIAIGYDKDRIYFMDPTTISNYTYIENEEFENRWHDYDETQKYYQTGIILKDMEKNFDLKAILKIE